MSSCVPFQGVGQAVVQPEPSDLMLKVWQIPAGARHSGPGSGCGAGGAGTVTRLHLSGGSAVPCGEPSGGIQSQRLVCSDGAVDQKSDSRERADRE